MICFVYRYLLCRFLSIFIITLDGTKLDLQWEEQAMIHEVVIAWQIIMVRIFIEM